MNRVLTVLTRRGGTRPIRLNVEGSRSLWGGQSEASPPPAYPGGTARKSAPLPTLQMVPPRRHQRSVQRLELYDCSAVVVAEPHRNRRRPVIDVEVADIGVRRHRIFHHVPALRINPPDPLPCHPPRPQV